MPHAKWGERPLAVIVLQAGQTVTGVALSEHIAPRVASFARPDAYVFVDALPRTSTGKVVKSALRQAYKNWP